MDVVKLLNDVNNLNEYITITQDSSESCKNSRIQLNMSTILALKKIRSFEVAYVNKYEDIGIASVLFERLLVLPPSKTWGVLSKEIVNLLQYWLDAVRKHLVKHSPHWWRFLKSLLTFLKEIRQKDSSLPNILVELNAEALFDLATTKGPDVMQRYEILHCFNMFCSESSRELRFALRTKFGHYFTQLANFMAGCGNLPTQYSIMETLLRWLLPRQDRTLRITSASKWFPARLYADNVVDIFLERPWMNFFQDARDFLNTHNEKSDLVTSVICRKLTVGDIVIIRDTDKTDSWLDLNSASKCASVLLDPRVLDAFGCTNHKSFETFVVAEDNTCVAKLYRESEILILSVQTLSPPRVLPSCIKLGDDVSCHVTAVISSRSDVKRLDGALRRIFDSKYEPLLDLEAELVLSPATVIPQSNKKPEEDARFSHPVEVRRRKHSGYIVKSRQPASWRSPSTASTSSLAQLHEKLAALPRYKFDKEPVGVCALPDLSIVTEASEADDRSNATLNTKPYGVCYKNLNNIVPSRQSQSDTESNRKCLKSISTPKRRLLSPVIREETPSCLLVATIGSADDSVINETVERLSKSKDYDPDNIVNLLVQEALNAKLERDKVQSDSGINIRSEELKDIGEVIENTPNKEIELNTCVRQPSKVVSSSDESNTEAISDTPNVYVNTRRKNITKGKATEKKYFDVQVVEEFFSQHFTENKEQEIVVSPTLAKKINETSSEFSDDRLDDGLISIANDQHNLDSFNFNNIEVIECLNNIVDKVCDEFDKCSQYLNQGQETAADDISDLEDDLPLKDILCKIKSIETKMKTSTKKPATPKKIKLKYKNKSHKIKQKNKLPSKAMTKMSTITEDSADVAEQGKVPDQIDDKIENGTEIVNNDDNIEHVEKEVEIVKNHVVANITAEVETPLIRRKRKLFSPKDEKIADEMAVNSQEKEFVDSNIKKTPKSTPTYKPYKDIERERQRHIRMPRNRKSRNIVATPSPRSKKMNDLFDKVKESANGEQVKLVTRASEVYNFSSDSEDDFKEKKKDISKRKSGNEGSTVSRQRSVNKRKKCTSKDECKTTKPKVNRRKNTKKGADTIEPVNDLIDERMRHKNDDLDTSIVVDAPEIKVTEPILVLEKVPILEEIIDKENQSNKKQQKAKPIKKNKTKTEKFAKEGKTNMRLRIRSNTDNDRTESPLPGLVIEEAVKRNKEDGDLSSNMVNKFKKICQNPEKYINESNTTQNMLSDNENIIYSPRTVSITDEFVQVEIQSKKPKIKKALPVKAEKVKEISPDCTNGITRITLSETSTKSEKSIATVGITGHGDSEEAPPSPKLITEELKHRNLETEYLDRSTKDYFEKLTNEINEINTLNYNTSPNNNTSSTLNRTVKTNEILKDTKSSDSPSIRSPVVSIERISLDDISRWLPSRRNSESDLNSPCSNKSKKTTDIESSKTVEVRHETDSDNDPDILEAIKRSLNVMKDKSPVLPSSTSKDRTESDLKNNASNNSTNTTKSKVVEAKKIEKKIQSTRSKRLKCTPRSCISPIQLFDSCVNNTETLTQPSLSDDEDYMNEIKKTISENLKRAPNESRSSIEETESLNDVPKEITTTDVLNQSIEQNSTQSVESIQDEMSTSTKMENSRSLKRKYEGERYDCKKKRVVDNNNIEDIKSGSGATVSSVDDWFKKNVPSCSQAATEISARESIQNVIEKLETTLIEIHQNTSKKFVHLFVNAQQQLSELKQERENMYKQVAASLLKDLVRMMDDKFGDMEHRSQKQDMDFMKHLKEQASAVIREDCKQKRAMVQLLKEDVQAVFEHNKRNTH